MNDALAVVMDAFGLDAAELRALLADDSRDRLNAMLALVELVERTTGVGRLAELARRPAAAYYGQTMLDLIAAGLHQELVEGMRGDFDWASVVGRDVGSGNSLADDHQREAAVRVATEPESRLSGQVGMRAGSIAVKRAA
jgi:hypothetical protein